MGFVRFEPITHELGPHCAALRRIRDRAALERSELWPRIADEVARVLGSVERGDRPATRAPGAPSWRLVAWNVQRGARFDAILGALRSEPALREADVLLLTEIDSGLGRSGNRNVARDLAEALDMSYAFGPSYLTLADDWGENCEKVTNTTALAGTAILSRAPIERAENVDLPELRDKFSSSERRLGRKRALLVELAGQAGPLSVAACHLDSNASPRQRAHQLAAILDRFEGARAPAIVGGDFNASTHDLSSPLAGILDLVGKLLRGGLCRMLDGYMCPDRRDDRPLFELLAEHQWSTEQLNDLSSPTYRYDFNDPYAIEKIRRVGGRALAWAVRRALRRWNGSVPARLDWFAGRAVRPLSARVINPRDERGHAVSDHAAIVCEIAA